MSCASPGPNPPETQAARVIDGDTIKLAGQTVRLHGIDAPETAQTCGDWACGQAASLALSQMMTGAEVQCATLDRDRYGRAIGRCTANGMDLAEAMVSRGYAWAYRRFSLDYVAAERRAKAATRGIWATEAVPAWEFRTSRARGADQGPNGCRIKGNISDRGKIYHAPWSPSYARTRINVQRGERWFCSEGAAIAAGWRAPYAR